MSDREDAMVRQAKVLAMRTVADVEFDEELHATLQKVLGTADLIVYRSEPLGPADALALYEAVANIAALAIQAERGER